jgi:putative endonuclease
MKTIHQYYVYLLVSKIRGTLYIGVTKDWYDAILKESYGFPFSRE